MPVSPGGPRVDPKIGGSQSGEHMEWSPIAKPRGSLPRAPNLADYEQARRGFDWLQADALLDGLPGGGLNIAHEAVFRHLHGSAADRVAIRFLAQGQTPVERTYRELAADARRFAGEHGGTVLKYAEIKPEMVDLSGGAKFDQRM